MLATVLKPNGTLPIQMGWDGAYTKLEFVGGPYDAFPGRKVAFGVCVRAERTTRESSDVWVPIKDFGVPKNAVVVEHALKGALQAALAGRQVYVGCMGGWGRTGLFLALLAKACGTPDPIGYVRKQYSPRAVETKDQEAYVKGFDVTYLQTWLFWAAWGKRTADLFFWWR